MTGESCRSVVFADTAAKALRRLRPRTALLVERALNLLATNPTAGVPLSPPLDRLRTLTISPGLKLFYTFGSRRLVVMAVHAVRTMRTKRTGRYGAILLAAGSPRCCNRSEQLFKLADQPAIAIPIGSLLSAAISNLVVVVGYEAAKVRQTLSTCSIPDPKRLTITYNGDYRGPLNRSLHTGLKVLEPGLDAVLIGLGNRPLVRHSTIRSIIETFERTRPRAVRPWFNSRPGHPVLFEAKHAESLSTTSPGTPVRDFIANSADVLDLEVDDPGVVTSVREFCRC